MSDKSPVRSALPFVGVAFLCCAVALATGLFLGSQLEPDDAPNPSTGSADAGFARDMKAHHAQAVEMSLLVREATDDPEIRMLALDIMTTQQQQIGQMYGWLDLWGLNQTTTAPPMGWMKEGDSLSDKEHDMSATGSGDTVMPGMASEADLRRLASARGERAARLFLRLMIPHHQGGVEMARVASTEAETPQVRRLAEGIVQSQSAEVKTLESLLAARPADAGN